MSGPHVPVVAEHLDAEGRAGAAVEAAWEVVRSTPYVALSLGEPVLGMPDLSEAAVVARSARARSVLDAIAALDTAALPHELSLTVEVARDAMTLAARAGEWYWLVLDPLGIGFYGMYAPTAYCQGMLLDKLLGVFARHDVSDDDALDRYLALLDDLGRLLRQLDARTRGQAARGIHLPRVQLEQAVDLVAAQRAAAPAQLVPSTDRLPDASQRQLVEARVRESVLPAYDETLGWLSHPDRAAAAGEAVGLGQLPGGAEVYAELVRLHTTLDLDPAEVHQRGLARVSEVRAEMQALLDETGADHPPREHMAALAEDPAWRAQGAAAVADVFERYLDRIRPHLAGTFRVLPAAACGVAPLPEALAASMTFGYYDLPSGRYLFNTANLSQQALANVAALTYHELVPGHHLHMASQHENQDLHPLRRHAFVNAFNEGWAEYAAHLAGELGMYQDPEERFGKLVMEAFLVTRLVVDTGMNALGWSLEDARSFMRENAFVSEAEVLSESIRYSCDLPAQALSYKVGDLFLQDLRGRMQAALGERFDVRDFHDAVLRPGSLPLRLVAANVERAVAALRDGGGADLSGAGAPRPGRPAAPRPS